MRRPSTRPSFPNRGAPWLSTASTPSTPSLRPSAWSTTTPHRSSPTLRSAAKAGWSESHYRRQHDPPHSSARPHRSRVVRRHPGRCRFAGVPGHALAAPAAHAEAVRRYALDTVMFPINPRLWADPAYRTDAEDLLQLCADRDVGVMVIKAAAARPWGDGERHSTTWYEPYTDAEGVSRGVRFALSTPGVTGFCTPRDIAVLATALDAAAHFTPMDEAERDRAIDEVSSERLIFPMPR